MINEEELKSAFAKIKTDIFSLGNELLSIKNELFELKSQINILNSSVDKLKLESIKPVLAEEYPTHIPTDELKKPAFSNIPTDTPTVPVEVRGLKCLNLDISTGNRGVPTDRQTNQQTDIPTHKMSSEISKIPLMNHLQDASEILQSLDAVKKEIRLKFKQITSQEMLIFSTIYQLEETFPEGVEYRQIAQKLRLSESSIRDYAQKLINKGIPVDKIKLNNKKILLKISSDLKKVTSLQALIQLREL